MPCIALLNEKKKKKKSVLAIGFRELFILEFHLIQETYMLLNRRGEIKEKV